MIKIEEGRRFSEETYLTKEDIKNVYNNADIESVWEKVLTYRSFFDVETDIRDKDLNHYKICLTKFFSASSYNLQVKLSKLLIDYMSLNNEYKNTFNFDMKKKALEASANYENINVSSSTLEKMVRGELENYTNAFFPLKAYLNAYDYALSKDHFDLNVMENINRLVTGEELDSTVNYRKSASIDIINPLSYVDIDKINIHLNELFSFLNQKEIPLLIRALIMVYALIYLRPFEYANEETIGLCVKSFIASNDLSIVGFSLPVESLAYSTSSAFFKKLKLSEETLDLTYFVNATLPFLVYFTDLLEKDLHEKKVKEQEYLSSLTNVEELTDQKVENIQDNLALPIFPLPSTSTKVEALTKKLLEVYPNLKKRQAHFYAGHCQIGLHYTIEQYKKEEKTVYETARASMEDLANRGFYKKEMYGKKFVYSPLPIKETE